MKSSLMLAAITCSIAFAACTTDEDPPQPQRFLLTKTEASKDGAVQSTLTFTYNTDHTASGIALKSPSDSNVFTFTWQNNRISEYNALFRDNPSPILYKLEYTGQLHTKTYSGFIPDPITLDSIVYNAAGQPEIIYIKDIQNDGHWQTLFVDKYAWTGNNITREEHYSLNHGGDTTHRIIRSYVYGNQPNVQATLPHIPALWLYSRSATGVSEHLATSVTSTNNGIESLSTSGTYTYSMNGNNLPTQRTLNSKDGKKTITTYTYSTY